jgi:anti-sigma B factor antagonist
MMMTATEEGRALVVAVDESRIDASVAVRFKDQMRDLTNHPARRVILDLSKVEFLDSSGLGAVVGAMKQLGDDRRLDLAGLTPMVDKVFRMTRMDSVFRIFPDRATALWDSAHAS